MPRKPKQKRRDYGTGGVQCIVEGKKYRVYANAGTRSDGKRHRATEVVYGSETAANRRWQQLKSDLDDGAYIAPDRMTVGDWLLEWLQAEYGVTVDMPRDELLRTSKVPGRTAETYASIIKLHLIPELGQIPIQRLRTTHLRGYFDKISKTLEPSTCSLHYMLLQTVLEAAVKERIIGVNVAREMTGKPKKRVGEDSHEEAMRHCWTQDESQQFIAAAREAGPQWAALFSLALDSGARKNELCGLKWEDVNWEAGTITIRRSLARASRDPIYGPTKGRRLRTIELMPETMATLKAHRRHQAEIRLKHGVMYHDHGLVFAKEPGKGRRWDTLGCPLRSNNIGQRVRASSGGRRPANQIPWPAPHLRHGTAHYG